MAGNIDRFKYTSDDGNDYSIRMDAGNAAAVGNVADAVSPDLPRTYHPRYVNATDSSDGSSRQIVVGDPTTALWLGPGASSITIEDFDTTPSTSTAHSVRSRVGEKRLAR